MSVCCRFVLTLLVTLSAGAASADDIQLLGTGQFDGQAIDLSGRSEVLENGEPHRRLGGFSALEYTGHGNQYLAVSDRGPDDGATGFLCRFHELEIVPPPTVGAAVQLNLIRTRMLVDRQQRPWSGSAAVFQADAARAGRLDPEGLRRNASDELFISDEYGPNIIQFDGHGHELNRLTLPARFHISQPGDTKDAENLANQNGRASNKGLEGLAISADGLSLYGLMQGPLLQDGRRDESGKVNGRNCRLIHYDLATGRTREFVYQLEDSSYGTNEILAIGDESFLVIERDSGAGAEARFRRLYRIELRGATDVAAVSALPEDQLPPEIQPVHKQLFLDFLAPEFGLSGPQMPEKIEGLTLGPLLPDGRTTLVVAVDNDFEAEHPTLMWVFAIPAFATR